MPQNFLLKSSNTLRLKFVVLDGIKIEIRHFFNAKLYTYASTAKAVIRLLATSSVIFMFIVNGQTSVIYYADCFGALIHVYSEAFYIKKFDTVFEIFSMM